MTITLNVGEIETAIKTYLATSGIHVTLVSLEMDKNEEVYAVAEISPSKPGPVYRDRSSEMKFLTETPRRVERCLCGGVGCNSCEPMGSH